MLRCPSCKTTYEAAALFDRCTVSWPVKKWLSFRCVRCRRDWYVAVHGEKVEIGDIDGAPGPCFMDMSSAVCPGLRATASEKGMTLRLAGSKWFVPARE